MGQWRYSSTILNLCSGEWSPSCHCLVTHAKQPQVPIILEVEWVPGPVWMLWRRKKNLMLLPGIKPRLLDRPPRSLVAIPTELCYFIIFIHALLIK
jgi:hypothetical protein